MQLISLANACLVALLRLFKPSVAADNVILPNVADGEREERRNTRGCRKNGAHFERNMCSKLCPLVMSVFRAVYLPKLKILELKKKTATLLKIEAAPINTVNLQTVTDVLLTLTAVITIDCGFIFHDGWTNVGVCL